MKQVLIQAINNPQVKASCAIVATEAANLGIKGLYERFMDSLAYKIAFQINKLEEINKGE